MFAIKSLVEVESSYHERCQLLKNTISAVESRGRVKNILGKAAHYFPYLQLLLNKLFVLNTFPSMLKVGLIRDQAEI